MRRTLYIILLIAALGSLCGGCNRVIGGSAGYLLLPYLRNPSFELNDSSSLYMWSPGDTTSHLHFSTDTAPGCGKYSIVLTPGGDSMTYNVTASIPFLEEEGTPYLMSVWAKTVGGSGTFSMFIFRPGGFAHIQGPAITDTTWKRYSISDTGYYGEGADSIVAYLTATTVSGVPAKIYFDSCEVSTTIEIPPLPATSKKGAMDNPIE